ncbi:MAG: PaaI family thioesterase [Actinobacteria bacterium]|nr:MAG: PaaI family thioesterase [Actinomycetota bacterium]
MSDITPKATNSFSGFHIRQTPMTTDEQLRADRADVMRHEIEELVAVAGTNFLDRSPIIGAINPIAAPIHITTSVDDNGRVNVVGCVTFGTAYEGPPGCVHGGIIAAYFDEVCGVAQSTTGNPGMTVNLTIDYRSPTPLHKPLEFRAHVASIEKRKIITYGSLYHGETLCAEATAIFVSMRPEVFERLTQLRNA